MEVVERTKLFIKQLLEAESTGSKLHRTQELIKHLQEFPASRLFLVQDVSVLLCKCRLAFYFLEPGYDKLLAETSGYVDGRRSSARVSCLPFFVWLC